MAFRRIGQGARAVSKYSTVFLTDSTFANHLPDLEIEDIGAGKNILRPPKSGWILRS
jgi:hypothetical protein